MPLRDMPALFKTIIVDDERLARRELRSLLADYAMIDVIGEAENVAQALNLIHTQKPDVVFLDIQMPGESGFRLLEQIQADFRIIFVTAFDAFAIRAFEVNALDYLLKPVHPDRLAQAIERLSAAASERPAPANPLEYEDRLFLETDEQARFLKISSIVCICAAGNYSELLMTDGKKLLVLKSLREWEERLPVRHFARIHRSTIVNLDYVERIERWFNHSAHVYVRHLTEPLVMSRRYAARLRLRFG